MVLASIVACGIVYLLSKVIGLVRGPALSGWGLIAYSTVWPGIATAPFAARAAGSVAGPEAAGTAGHAAGRGRPDRAAASLMAAGLLIGAAAGGAWIVLWHSELPPAVKGWLGIAVILGTFHFGLSDVLTGAMRAAGFPVRRLFDAPLRSRSLREFWSLRWNQPFVQMNQVVFMPALRRWFGRKAAAAAFVLSGLLHELAISVPVGTGHGLPTLYFALQAMATAIEGRWQVRRWHPVLARMWTWGWLLIPIPLLFHEAFRNAAVLPLMGGNR